MFFYFSNTRNAGSKRRQHKRPGKKKERGAGGECAVVNRSGDPQQEPPSSRQKYLPFKLNWNKRKIQQCPKKLREKNRRATCAVTSMRDTCVCVRVGVCVCV
jgi:hypothetical protein